MISWENLSAPLNLAPMTWPKFKLIESSEFLLSWLLLHLKTFIYTNYWFQRVLRFVSQFGKISTRSSLVRLDLWGWWWLYDLDLICTNGKNRQVGVLIAIVYPFLLLRLDTYGRFHIFSCLSIVLVADFMWIHVNLYLDLSRAYAQKRLKC